MEWWWALAIAIPLGILAALALLRKAALRDRIGSFRCKVRAGGEEREVPGYLVFGSTAIYVYRSVFVGVRRFRAYTRHSFEMSADPAGDGQVNVHMGADVLRVSADVYAAMVAWVDAAGPREEPLL